MANGGGGGGGVVNPPTGFPIIRYLSFPNSDWLLIREVQWFCWTQELLVPVEKFTVRMLMVRLELATPGLQTQCSNHWAIQLKSYCWEGVEFIQLVYCIIRYLSFPNCDWLLIREVQWFYWTQELLVPVDKFAVRMPMLGNDKYLMMQYKRIMEKVTYLLLHYREQ